MNEEHNELVIKSSPFKPLVSIFGSLIFTIIGIYMLKDGQSMGWVVVSFFGILGIPALLALIYSPGSMRLTPEGLEIHLFRAKDLYPWSDIERFTVKSNIEQLDQKKWIYLKFKEQNLEKRMDDFENIQDLYKDVAPDITTTTIREHLRYMPIINDFRGYNNQELVDTLNKWNNRFGD